MVGRARDESIRMKGNIFVYLSVLVVAFVGCSGNSKNGTHVQAVKTSVAMATGGGQTITYPGRTKSGSEVSAAFRVSGTLERVLVQRGDHVVRGQVLAELDARDYEVQLAATEAEYAQAEAEAERIFALYAEQATTASNYDKARYGLQQLAEKRQLHRNQLSDTRLVAPVSGVVRERLHEAGETVGAGTGVVAIAADGGGVEVEVNVSVADWQRMGRLTKASAHREGETEVRPLSVVSVSGVAGASQLYAVRLLAAGAPWGAGMAVAVDLTFTDDEEGETTAVSIPSTAVLNEGGRCYVFVVSNGKAVRREVKAIALHTDGNMEVTGLNAGETVVVAGVHHLTDGQDVESIGEPSELNVGGLI